jgi:hypothetical protein
MREKKVAHGLMRVFLSKCFSEEKEAAILVGRNCFGKEAQTMACSEKFF